jgi:predicted Abi (CAAX) family protease
MPAGSLQQFWQLIRGALTLNPAVFTSLDQFSQGVAVAIAIILLAGLSQAIGQSIVLFANRVKPLRFFLSLGTATLIYFATYSFWVLSIWFTVVVLFGGEFRVYDIATALALCYAPQLLGFLVALPYFGVPISILLSIWTLLAILVGVEATTNLTPGGAILAVGLGWVVLQLGQRTIGRPLAHLAAWLTTKAAGRPLITNQGALAAELNQSGSGFAEIVAANPTDALPAGKSASTKQLYQFLAIVFSTFLVIGLIATTQRGFVLWFEALNSTVQLVLQLGYLGLIAVIIAILLTPLESLSWWAGWQKAKPLNPGVAIRAPEADLEVVRYVTYLDGINQGNYNYPPNVERLLEHLAQALPPNVLVVKGIIPYSVSNNPLTARSPVAFIWRWVDRAQAWFPRLPVDFVVNIRNVFAVMVSADARYGPIQNQGLAQVLYDSLFYHGYQPGSGVPITLIGYSGGGQMSMGAVRYLQPATGAPIDVISLAGVISGNTGTRNIVRLYHLAGSRDFVEKLGSIIFPARWPVALLSNWNWAKRRGRIVFIPLGKIGHNGPNSPLGAETRLPDGRTCLQQTVDIMTGILLQDWARTRLNPAEFIQPSNYDLYQAAPFNRVAYFPIGLEPNQDYYQPLGAWMGRLILPDVQHRQNQPYVLMEVHHTAPGFEALIGRTLPLLWSEAAEVQAYVQLVTMDVDFVEQVQVSQRQGFVHPDRINHWPQVDPLESIAGAHAVDDVIVRLPEPVQVVEPGEAQPRLLIESEPVQITGRYYGLVRIVEPVGDDRFRVRHYSQASNRFDGPEETVYIPSVLPNRDDHYQSSNRQIERSPLNQQGWYIFGAQNDSKEFVVQAIAPFQLFDLTADVVITGEKATLKYINFDYWKNTRHQKGQVTTALLLPQLEASDQPVPSPKDIWQEGDRALLMEVYGGIGGNKKEFAPGGIYFGHFSFGIAHVIREPLTGKLRFNIEYRQIFTHSPEAVVAGANHWTCFMGDRQRGRVGFRPVADVLINFPPFTEDYDFGEVAFSPMNRLIRELDVMGARYRIGDGTGMTSVSPVNSCVQDSTQALLTALNRLVAEFDLNPLMQKWLREHPDHEQTRRFLLLMDLLKSLESNLQPLGFTRSDWRTGELTLGRFAGETPGKTVINALASWRSLLPRLANDVITMIFLQLGATVWVMRANQIGGDAPDIEPIAPTDFGLRVPKIKRGKRLN